jgi:ribonuclease P/MRP protein subunit RPP40
MEYVKHTMVLGMGQQEGPKPKCYFTQFALPSYIDNAHPPTKKEPFRTVLDQQFNHNVRLLCWARKGESHD